MNILERYIYRQWKKICGFLELSVGINSEKLQNVLSLHYGEVCTTVNLLTL